MGVIPLPPYEVLRRMAGEGPEADARFDAFLTGLALNPQQQSPWAWWRTRHLRRQVLESMASNQERERPS